MTRGHGKGRNCREHSPWLHGCAIAAAGGMQAAAARGWHEVCRDGRRLPLSAGRAGARHCPPQGCSGSTPPGRPRTARHSRRLWLDSDGSPGARARPDHGAALPDPEVPGLCSDPQWDPSGGDGRSLASSSGAPWAAAGGVLQRFASADRRRDFALNASRVHAAVRSGMPHGGGIAEASPRGLACSAGGAAAAPHLNSSKPFEPKPKPTAGPLGAELGWALTRPRAADRGNANSLPRHARSLSS